MYVMKEIKGNYCCGTRLRCRRRISSRKIKTRSRDRWGLFSVECHNLCYVIVIPSSKIRERSFYRWKIQILASWNRTRRCTATAGRRQSNRLPHFSPQTLLSPFCGIHSSNSLDSIHLGMLVIIPINTNTNIFMFFSNWLAYFHL